jgi:MoaA/NifB/PqqE/SkfB family radical SAM enzyme
MHPLRRCNIACAHCYSLSGPDKNEENSIELLSACLEDAVSLGYRQLAVSGGEPLLYKSLPALLSHARTLGMVTTVTTNGMLMTLDRWATIANHIDVAAISIDGTPEEHDAIRGKKGAFARTLANLEVIRASDVPFGFIFTLTQYNVNSLEFIVRLAAEQSARSVQVHPLVLVGRAAYELPNARPDSLELLASLIEAARLGSELGVVIHVDALTVNQIVKFREHFVAKSPVTTLIDCQKALKSFQ